MARHLVHSFILAAALSPLVNAGPCRPSQTSSLETVSTATTASESESLYSSLSVTAATSETSQTLETTVSDTETTITEPEETTQSSTFETLSTTATISAFETSQTVETTETGTDTTQTEFSTISESDTTTTGCVTTTIYIDDETSTFDFTTIPTDATTFTDEITITATTTDAPAETSDGPFECVDNMKDPSPRGAVCGKRGSPNGNDGFKFLGNGPVGSVMDCYTACMQKSNCKSFIVAENSFCELYRGTADTDGSETDFKLYETKCFCDTGVEQAPTCEDITPILNGGWDTDSFAPWEYYPVADGRDIVDFDIVRGGADGSAYRFQTGDFHFDKSMWLYQDITACPGITFDCSFKWKWDKYYEIPQDEGFSLVPYVRIYQDNQSRARVSDYPTSESDTKRWIEASFSFTVPDSGETRIWYVASSPQGKWKNTTPDTCTATLVRRRNNLALDSLSCRAR
ncbi:hypothetical protein NW762_010982 [Fusarium torreyae]|uniref:Apple domain-containing protein n=1 Tax=Fusarium torreyae TaxID=1237075 RepID=A0A9W8VA69_9HYPO|nr:hypothetical protein NW762_010982 [Fusarium torreyae]